MAAKTDYLDAVFAKLINSIRPKSTSPKEVTFKEPLVDPKPEPPAKKVGKRKSEKKKQYSPPEDPPKAEPKAEPPKAEPPKAEPPKVEPKAEPPKTEPKTEPKVEPPKKDKGKGRLAPKAKQSTICLNMIVKNEKDVILRCLQSVYPYIDYWVIVDTGSTDGTQEIIKDFFKNGQVQDQNGKTIKRDIPGELHERPWVNFSHNRNEALKLAEGKADYVAIIDADEVWASGPQFTFPRDLDSDGYYITTIFGALKYERVQLFKADGTWGWFGPCHEYPNLIDSKLGERKATVGYIQNLYNLPKTDGSRSKDKFKFKRDALLFEQHMIDNPEASDLSRSVFYCAQSYKDYKDHEMAFKLYKQRVDMADGYPEEIYLSLVEMGNMTLLMGKPFHDAMQYYLKAYQYRPQRIEAIYQLIIGWRMDKLYYPAYALVKEAVNMPVCNDRLFMRRDVLDFRIFEELLLCSYFCKDYAVTIKAMDILIKNFGTYRDNKEHVNRIMTNISNLYNRDAIKEFKPKLQHSMDEFLKACSEVLGA